MDKIVLADDAPVLLRVADGVANVTLNRPRNANTIDLSLAHEFMRVMHRCENDASLRAIVIRGNGKLFCGGGDLVAIHANGEGAAAYVRELLAYLHEAISALARIPVPVVAAAHGAAAGAGLSLAAACDLVVATSSCRFVMAYPKVGLTPDGSASWFLPRVIGLRRALQLALTNRELSADEAMQWSIVTEVVADDALETRVSALAAELVDGPTAALGEAKRLLRSSLDTNLEAQMVRETDAICRALERPEALAGFKAFVAKVKPEFRTK